MQTIELLAPAGSMEALIAAVQNGCDAVYLGGTMFGARAFANNFDETEMVEAITYAHSYGVKVYVTMNTLLFEEEMDAACTYAKFLYEQGVDALIIQDLGLFDLLHQRFPDLELHASTQMHIHNEEGIQLVKEAGMKRVVLPRETPIEEIRKFCKMGIDVEVFVQGALCISYSGQCLMSAKKLSRSGNRGACAQMCRMKYRLGKEGAQGVSYVDTPGEYLLSPKDLNTLTHIPELIEAGVTSFKIEGRMKRPAYVALMVALYRKAIDAYLHHEPWKEADAEEAMRKIFNRDFTTGHLFHAMGSALMNPYRPNHMGVPLGEVIHKQGRKARIRLCAPLSQHDGIRFLCEGEDIGCMVNKLYLDGLLVNQAQKDAIVEVEVDGYLPKGTKVVKTSDVKQLEQLQKTYERTIRKVPIYMQCTLNIGEVAQLCLWDDAGHVVEVFGSQKVELAQKRALEPERIQQQLKKCGDSIFTLAHLDLQIEDGSILAIKELNELRRQGLQKLYEQRVAKPQNLRYGTYHRSFSLTPLQGLYVSVRTKEQLECVSAFGVTKLFAPSPLHSTEAIPSLGYLGKRVMKSTYPAGSILFQENGGIYATKGIADHFVNVTNSYAAAFLFAHGVTGIILSEECSEEQERALKEAFQQRYGIRGNFLAYGYGSEELMVMEYCPINFCEKDNNKQNCALCKGSNRYFLEDINHHRYPLYGDEDCRMHILDEAAQMKIVPAHAIYLSFYQEQEDMVNTILHQAKAALIQE